ncbi:hypothetical protein NE237_017835 [Protea cynaroides]|uniref:Uncharacterized protein n=1 Tax=Protea cynaroides TaxID=273540 RepID=A0A9Q0K8W4_9MAGN|nr:hypothetical protein NE237_017835 [Protea cynaroides]
MNSKIRIERRRIEREKNGRAVAFPPNCGHLLELQSLDLPVTVFCSLFIFTQFKWIGTYERGDSNFWDHHLLRFCGAISSFLPRVSTSCCLLKGRKQGALTNNWRGICIKSYEIWCCA